MRVKEFEKEFVLCRLTCTKSIIAGVHFSVISVNGGALHRIISAVQTAMTDCVKITAI